MPDLGFNATASRRTAVLSLALSAFLSISMGCADRETPQEVAKAPEFDELVTTFHLGVAAMQVGQLEYAEVKLARASELAPEEPAVYVNRGILQLRLGDADAAASSLETARTLAPSSFEVALIQGHVDGLRGSLDEAAAHLRRAHDARPNDVRARFELVRVLERLGGDDAEREVKEHLEAIHEQQPDNLAVLVERARAAVRRGDRETLADSLNAMAVDDLWPAVALTQYRALEDAARDENLGGAGRPIAFLRNVLAQLPAFRNGLREIDLSADSGAAPLDYFLVLETPGSTPEAPDTSLSFTLEALNAAENVTALVPIWNTAESPKIFHAAPDGLRLTGSSDLALPSGKGESPSPSAFVALDWNHDFLMDVAIASPDGWRLALADGSDRFTDVTSQLTKSASVSRTPSFGIWTADIEMDGDLDMIIGRIEGSPLVARNNGDGTIELTDPFPGVSGLRGFAWGDLDGDADPDAVLLDEEGAVHVYLNEQSGRFTPTSAPSSPRRVMAIAIADVDNDGRLEILALDEAGSVGRTSDGLSQFSEIAGANHMQPGVNVGVPRLLTADLDNNGSLDLIASSPAGSSLWLSDQSYVLSSLDLGGNNEVMISAAADVNADGKLDLLGLSSGRSVALVNHGTAGYHWQVIRPRAIEDAGDGRINSFGVGGEIEVRSGLLLQKQLLTGRPLHFGLGARTVVDLAQILWPNGVKQAEFELPSDQSVVAEQRLKGSCPWVFAFDGEGMRFVTDFIWRSPLGLRINAQDTAGNLQTEDWVKIRGDQLVANDRGMYDIRISAELWETHFFDHVSLMTVDHPAATEVFVDERFARNPPSLEVHATGSLQPIERATDDAGRDVTPLIQQRDGRHVGTFERGRYQGVAKEHFIEIELGEEPPRDEPLWLLAYGFVYPTDSSINVAMGQGEHPQPRGLAVEVMNRDGDWVIAQPDIGFPSGKNKTILVDLTQLFDDIADRRLRLRTNLEVYWDWLGWATHVEDPRLEAVRIAPMKAELRYRGFSETNLAERHQPEIPDYDRISNTTQRWRDLVGFYTRFGDIRELLASIDDRYVIMNAGDEMAFEFEAPPPPPEGWVRDFVLIGDGWVKDGDYNTAYSRTVEPLPSHDQPEYTGVTNLESDPVFKRHSRDWEIYQTRFVGTDAFVRGTRARGTAGGGRAP